MIDLQNRIHEWVERCFGGNAARNPKERGLRLLEETVEFAQAVGLTEEQVNEQVRATFSKPVGDARIEVAQVGITLLSAAAALDVDLKDAVETEMARIGSRPDTYYRNRWNSKLKG